MCWLTGSLRDYVPCTAVSYRKRCRHFIVWLYLHDIALAEVDDDVFSRFLAHDCTCAHPHFFIRTGRFAGRNNSRSKIGLFIEYLIGTGVAPPRPTPACEEPGRHVARFLVWLRRYRGIGEATIQGYHKAMRVLLPLLGDDPGQYGATLIRNAVQHRLETASRDLVRRETSALRLYLRFLALEGLCRPGLVAAVPAGLRCLCRDPWRQVRAQRHGSRLGIDIAVPPTGAGQAALRVRSCQRPARRRRTSRSAGPRCPGQGEIGAAIASSAVSGRDPAAHGCGAGAAAGRFDHAADLPLHPGADRCDRLAALGSDRPAADGPDGGWLADQKGEVRQAPPRPAGEQRPPGHGGVSPGEEAPRRARRTPVRALDGPAHAPGLSLESLRQAGPAGRASSRNGRAGPAPS